MRFMRLRILCLGLILLGIAAGCRSAPRADEARAAPSTVRVENRSWTTMTVYVLRDSQRIRLDTVPGASTRVLELPSWIVFGTPVRFLADPIGGSDSPVSEEMTVTPGDEVVLVIPAG
ncbi:MAG: hypothetical protein ABR599_00130 [Gemmatimonadota bacterium]